MYTSPPKIYRLTQDKNCQSWALSIPENPNIKPTSIMLTKYKIGLIEQLQLANIFSSLLSLDECLITFQRSETFERFQFFKLICQSPGECIG